MLNRYQVKLHDGRRFFFDADIIMERTCGYSLGDVFLLSAEGEPGEAIPHEPFSEASTGKVDDFAALLALREFTGGDFATINFNEVVGETIKNPVTARGLLELDWRSIAPRASLMAPQSPRQEARLANGTAPAGECTLSAPFLDGTVEICVPWVAAPKPVADKGPLNVTLRPRSLGFCAHLVGRHVLIDNNGERLSRERIQDTMTDLAKALAPIWEAAAAALLPVDASHISERTLRATGDRDIRFVGWEIASHAYVDEHDRHVELTLYRTRAGNLICYDVRPGICRCHVAGTDRALIDAVGLHDGAKALYAKAGIDNARWVG